MSKRIIKFIGIGIGVLLLLLILFLLLSGWDKITGATPTLTIETPQKINISETEEFTLDVTVSALGEAIYPAASMSIAFDSSRLEFIGVEEGNVFIRDDESDISQKLPNWSCNPKQSNKSGKINIMYLDTTGGKNAFSKELLAEDDNVVLRLTFRLRGSVRSGDVCDLIFDDAVFAASDENESLSMTRNTLKVRNGKIVVGE
ncbi:MAG: cohesin domain-containing protein [Faecalimonas sp.]|nr:cohesin domain-containing protein [Faecalimonas sp.]